MSIKIIRDRLDQYRQGRSFTLLEEENAIKEMVQEIALSSLARAGFFKVAAFQGGTCLRILYGLNRFSEDLDFALNKPDPTFSWPPYLKNMQAELETFGFKFTIESRDRDKAVKSVFLKEDSIGSILALTYNGQSGSRKIKIKLEIDTHPPSGAINEQKYISFPVNVPVVTHDLPSLLAGKSHALLCRATGKGRDWFDFVWYAGRRTPPNFDLLSNAINQFGPWKHQRITVTKQWYAENLARKIKDTDWQTQRKDVERFLKPSDLDLLQHWSHPFFIDRLAEIVPTFHISVKTSTGKQSQFSERNIVYYERDEAVKAGKRVFEKTTNVIMVEVCQFGVARPVAIFS